MRSKCCILTILIHFGARVSEADRRHRSTAFLGLLRSRLEFRALARFQNGYIRVPEGPGLGVELNEEACRAHLRVPGYFEPTPQFDNYILDEFRTGGPYPHLDGDGKLVNTPQTP